MNEYIKRLSDEEFKSAIMDKNYKLLDGIRCAHGTDQSKFKIAFGVHPHKYYVDEEQIKTAKSLMEEENRDRKHNYLKNETLVFYSMGMSFKTTGDYIGNHRIRAYFVNCDGIKCFIEVGTAKNNNMMRCDHSIYNVCGDAVSLKERGARERNNYKNLERGGVSNLKYTFKNLLKVVNEHFNCNFNYIVLEDFFCPPSYFVSVSPKKEVLK